jgi:hypothetical protein
MGHLQAREMAELGADSLEQSLRWHLTSNHFPPVPTSMVPICIEAIDAVNEGDWDRKIALPESVGYKGLTVAPASAIVEQHHLEAWIENEEDY